MTDDEVFLLQIRREAMVYALDKFIATKCPLSIIEAFSYRYVEFLELLPDQPGLNFDTNDLINGLEFMRKVNYRRVSRTWKELIQLKMPEHDIRLMHILINGVTREYSRLYPFEMYQLSLIASELQ